MEEVDVIGLDPAFWGGRRVLVTGHTGFKGAWLVLMLQALGAKVSGIALDPETGPSMYTALAPWHDLEDVRCDVRDAAALGRVVAGLRPQVAFHLAAQALVGRSYADPMGTFATNVNGTGHLLAALRSLPGLQAAVVVTSDKVYRNDGLGRPFLESDPLGGADPYSASKACAELLVASWRSSYPDALPPLATARAGNVIGGGDFGQDRLLPDLARAQDAGEPLVIRRPSATRPWQYVLDVLDGYLRLARLLVERPSDAPSAVNFGPSPSAVVSVRQLLDLHAGVTDAAVRWQPSPEVPFEEAARLAVDPGLAERSLGWKAKTSLHDALRATARWTAARRENRDLRALSLALLDEVRP